MKNIRSSIPFIIYATSINIEKQLETSKVRSDIYRPLDMWWSLNLKNKVFDISDIIFFEIINCMKRKFR